jgi:hypothetical protein
MLNIQKIPFARHDMPFAFHVGLLSNAINRNVIIIIQIYYCRYPPYCLQIGKEKLHEITAHFCWHQK